MSIFELASRMTSNVSGKGSGIEIDPAFRAMVKQAIEAAYAKSLQHPQ